MGVTAMDEDDADFGGITGNIVLVAHGTPKVLPGKVIGSHMGQKTPEQIVAILTENPDKSKRIAKKYSGVITLAGCFTASGGPEGEKEDPVFAKKVRDLLGAKGYKQARVEGMPGTTATRRFEGGTDEYGKTAKKGDELAHHAMEEEEGIEAYQKRIDENVEKLSQASDHWKGTQEEFDRHPKVVEVVEQMRKDSAEITRIYKQMAKANDPTKVNKINATKKIVGLKGYFGPEKYKGKPWYKKLFD
jgi:hypothetical protein